MEGILISLDREAKRGQVDTRNDDIGILTIYFQEIPARTPTIMLTAEGEGCCETLSIHKSFTK